MVLTVVVKKYLPILSLQTHSSRISFQVPQWMTATDLSMYLLDEALVALVTGEAFGDPNCVRLSYAASEEVLIEAIKRIKAALEKLS